MIGKGLRLAEWGTPLPLTSTLDHDIYRLASAYSQHSCPPFPVSYITRPRPDQRSFVLQFGRMGDYDKTLGEWFSLDAFGFC